MSFCVLLVLSKVGKLPDQHILRGVLVLVSEVRDVHGGAARADPVGADWAGIPGCEPPCRHLLRWTGRLRAALDVGGDIARDVEQHHVVSLW